MRSTSLDTPTSELGSRSRAELYTYTTYTKIFVYIISLKVLSHSDNSWYKCYAGNKLANLQSPTGTAEVIQGRSCWRSTCFTKFLMSTNTVTDDKTVGAPKGDT